MGFIVLLGGFAAFAVYARYWIIFVTVPATALATEVIPEWVALTDFVASEWPFLIYCSLISGFFLVGGAKAVQRQGLGPNSA